MSNSQWESGERISGADPGAEGKLSENVDQCGCCGIRMVETQDNSSVSYS